MIMPKSVMEAPPASSSLVWRAWATSLSMRAVGREAMRRLFTALSTSRSTTSGARAGSIGR